MLKIDNNLVFQSETVWEWHKVCISLDIIEKEDKNMTAEKATNHGNTAEDSSTAPSALQTVEDLIMREKEIKRLMRSFNKEDISKARKKIGKTVNRHVIKFTDIMRIFLKDNSTLLQNVFDATKTLKRPDGQKSIKIIIDSFKVSITKK